MSHIHFEKATLAHKDLIFEWLEEPHMKEFWDNSQEHKDDILNFINGQKQHYFYGTTMYWVGFLDGQPYCFLLTDEIRPDQGDVTDLHRSLIFLYLPSLFSLAGLNMVALISPGPDFAVVVRNSLIYSRRTAFLTAFGIALGILVHVSYTLLGLGLIIKESAWLFVGIKYLGAGYLLYIGYKGLKAKKATLALGNVHHTRDIAALSAIRSGFLTNALNPKCMLFIMSLFSVVIPPHTPALIMTTYGIIIFVETLVWFSFVAFCLSGKRTREKFNFVGHWIERVTGGILVMLGTKLFFTV